MKFQFNFDTNSDSGNLTFSDLDTSEAQLLMDIATGKQQITSLAFASDGVNDNVGTNYHRQKIAEVMQLIDANTKLAAVKCWKEYSGIGLKQAKEFIDNLCANFTYLKNNM